jgi:hypothetical protein
MSPDQLFSLVRQMIELGLKFRTVDSDGTEPLENVPKIGEQALSNHQILVGTLRLAIFRRKKKKLISTVEKISTI